MAEGRGSIAFFGTYRPPVPLDLFSCPVVTPSARDEVLLTDGVSYNQNGQPVPEAAVNEIMAYLRKNKPALASECEGGVTGLVFVSERESGLETLHLALRTADGKVKKVVSLGDIYGPGTFGGVRMEDSPCIAGGFQVKRGGKITKVGHSLVYVSTKEPVKARRSPWTVVYRTDLADGKTERLTTPGQFDLSPAVSPSGDRILVATFRNNRWEGEIENLKTDITIMNVDKTKQLGSKRDLLIEDGGWPTWASDNVVFFHRGVDTDPASNTAKWAVYRYDIAAKKEERVTPEGIDAMTPAAISDTRVAVATIREKSKQVQMAVEREVTQYRHIEIFDTAGGKTTVQQVTQGTRPYGDHYNPFVLRLDGGTRIGYHRCRTDMLIMAKKQAKSTTLKKKFDEVRPPPSHSDVGLFRVTGVSPTVSKNGEKVAFVDNEFKAVWLADSKGGLRIVYSVDSTTSVFSTSWNQNDALDTLYVCEGPAFSPTEQVVIVRLPHVSDKSRPQEPSNITMDGHNCAFPSTNFEGNKLVYRSSGINVNNVQGDEEKKKLQHKSLFVVDAQKGYRTGVHRLTQGPWTDTHCSWSPVKGCDWIVFSSHRDKPDSLKDVKDHGLDAGYFAVYLVNAKDVWNGGPVPNPVRVVYSAASNAGHINHPVFSPDMKSIVFAADLAAVSADPISLPHFTHSVRPYGDIFSVNLVDMLNMENNKDIQDFDRITHSRYEYSTPTWATPADDDKDPNAKWRMLANVPDYGPRCPYTTRGKDVEKEGWPITGHLAIKPRCC